MMVQSVLVKDDRQRTYEEGCSTTSNWKGLDQSRMDHHWKTSTLDSYGDLKIIRSSSSYWYMISDLFLLFMCMLFDCNHQGIPRVMCSGSIV